MPQIRINISEKNLALLEELKNEWGLSNRSKALERIIDKLLQDKEPMNEQQEEQPQPLSSPQQLELH